MNRLPQLIKDDMKPALGVTESGAIAFTCGIPLRGAGHERCEHLPCPWHQRQYAEKTMAYMGRIASPGMTGTAKTIVEIFEEKLQKGL